MKCMRKIFFLIFVCYNLFVQAQIAIWVIEPNYDFIEVTDNGFFKVVKDNKIGLLNKEGSEVLPIEFDSITPFYEDRALLFKDNNFYGITDIDGNITVLENNNYELCYGAHRFYNGFLLVKYNHSYYYLNKDGVRVLGPYALAYPFFYNYACVKSYVNYLEDPQETYYEYISQDGTPAVLPHKNKKDISFMSSFYKDTAIIAIKKKFYTINAKNFEITPISIDSTFKRKSLVVAEKKIIQPIEKTDGFVVEAVNGEFVFDKFMRPIYWLLLGNTKVEFEYPQTQERRLTSSFQEYGVGNAVGLKHNNKDFLPPQFQKVLHLEDDFAIVQVNDKCGVLTIDENNRFVFKLNNNEHIGFNHQFHNTKLTALMPQYIKCSSATVSSLTEGCEIQIETRKENENIEGNTLIYTCRLAIPKSLTDTLSIQDYFFSLKYNGFISLPQKVSISEWYVKYYEVKLSNTSFTLSSNNDTISVEFDLIKTDVARNDESNYFKNIDVVAPNLEQQPILTKITENHYSIQLLGIEQEDVNFSIRITEVGCPSIDYPFEMTFKKEETEDNNQRTKVTITPIKKKRQLPKEEIIFIDDF